METNPKGWPRPTLDKGGQNTPLPWVEGNNPKEGMWSRTDGNRAEAAGEHNLCIICGNGLSSDFVWMQANLAGMQRIADKKHDMGLPAPTRVHPKCGTIAAIFCPHLKGNKFPARDQNGQMLTHEQLRDLARKSPKPVNDDEPDIPSKEITEDEKELIELLQFLGM